MTHKKLMRRLFADLWFYCAKSAGKKIDAIHINYPKDAEAWEQLMIRCEKRALKHAELAPEVDCTAPETSALATKD